MLTFISLIGLTFAEPSAASAMHAPAETPAISALERVKGYPDQELRVMGPAVTRAGRRLTVPQYLMLVDRDQADVLLGRIERNRGASTALGAVGALGFAAVMAGNLGRHLDESERHGWQHVRSAGFVSGLVGLAGSLLTSRTAQRLEHNFSATQDRRDTLETVRAYNERLQQDLGVRLASEPRIWAPPGERAPPPPAVLRRR